MKQAIKNNPPKQKINVWIIDDNKSYCILLSESLNENKKIKCERYFHSVYSALDALHRARRQPSAILLDIKMPRMSGLDGIKLIREASPFTRIIMLTSYEEEREIQSALDQGANGYLLKNSTAGDIIRAVENALMGGVPLDPMITKKIMSMLLSPKKEKKVNYRLSKREKEIVGFISKGFTTDKIAKKLYLSYYTIDTHLKNIYQKLNVHSRHTLVVKAYSDGLI